MMKAGTRVLPTLEALEEREVLSVASTGLGAFDPSTGNWYLRSESSAGAPDAGQFPYGAPGWLPVAGDWNGSGNASVGVVDPSTETWYLRNENSAGAPDAGVFRYGLPGWIPVVGDWTGSGHDGIGAFDPTTGTWYLRNEASAGPADAGVFKYGAPGWIPVAGNWTGGTQDGIGVVNPATETWYLRSSASAGLPDINPFAYGAPGWKPVVGDWDGDGSTTVGVVAPNGTWYLRNSNSSGFPDITPFAYGLGTWAPVAGNWNGPDTPFVISPIGDVSLSASASRVLDLAGNFSDPNISDSVVRLDTSEGPIFVELFDSQAPRTVANFLDYVEDGAYTNAIFHRVTKLSDGTPSTLAGGEFTFQDSPSRLVPITTAPPVQNEADPANRSNVTGTIAMQTVGSDPNSATDTFFFNLTNNSSTLDHQNGGATVFGKVVSALDQQTLAALAGLPAHDESAAPALPSSEKGVFSQIPLQNYTGSNFPTDTTADNYALISSATITHQTEVLTYSVVGDTNPGVVSTSIVHNRLTLQAAQSGTTTLTVRATNSEGAFVDTSFNVTVG